MKKDKDKTGLYFQIFSIHGLVRYQNMELGRDADTGGQVKYVVELGEALSQHESVQRVDLFTRLIDDKRVSDDYKVPVEEVNDKFRIVRIQCGGKRYMRKELLWPHLDEYIDKTIKFIRREGLTPDIVHGHYPDAGYVGIWLSTYFGTPFVFTGHSLGRPKRQKLLTDGMKEDDVNKKYNIDTRIGVEEEIIQNADLIITSTRQEIDKQYGMYENKKVANRFAVIPPGINLEKFYPYYHDLLPESHKVEEAIQAHASVLEEMNRFFINPEKPLVLAICRADKRKNITGLVEAFGKNRELQAIANLAVFAGLRKNIKEMEDNEKDVLTEMLLMMDKYDLYGKMAIPKKHDFTYEVPELYRIVGEKKGVFVNVALTEPFGMTLIEASACGVPIVATNDGGPRDIISNCQNGALVDPTRAEAIAKAIKSILVEPEKWKELSSNGIRGVHEHYSWDAHVGKYVEAIDPFLSGKKKGTPIFKRAAKNPVGDRLTNLNCLVITDIDDTLIGDPESLERLKGILGEHWDHIGFGVATGRTVESTLEVFQRFDLPAPDVIISSVGTELYYGDNSFPDKGWQAHISKRWNRKRIQKALEDMDFLQYQEEAFQRPHKISYYMSPEKDRIALLHDRLIKKRCHFNLVYSDGQFLDILPFRASKGKAVQYLSYKWEIPIGNIMVCGDSGNDAEMLSTNALGVVAGNHDGQLEALRGKRRVYFSDKPSAAAIIDGLRHYELLRNAEN
jgi:sucrose-phosphate synthase